MVEAAALATRCQGSVTFSGLSRTMRDNDVLRARFAANLAAYGEEDLPPDLSELGSSDMGNVSHVVPTIHPHIAICERGVPGHSPAFRDAASTDRADDVTLLAAIVIAQTACELFADPALLRAAWDRFRASAPQPQPALEVAE
jgi:metal-dependent amidase/aminoacylase/carboxypeptidase family protein